MSQPVQMISYHAENLLRTSSTSWLGENRDFFSRQTAANYARVSLVASGMKDSKSPENDTATDQSKTDTVTHTMPSSTSA